MDSKHLHQETQQYDRAQKAVRAGQHLQWVATALLLTVFVGNIFDIEPLYSQFTSTTTLQTVILLGIVHLVGIFATKQPGADEHPLAQVALVSALLFTIVSFFIPVSSILDSYLWHWIHQGEDLTQHTERYITGRLTRLTIIALILARLVKTFDLHGTRSILLWVGMTLPTVSIVAHMYGNHSAINFMSVWTALIAFSMSLSQLLQQAHRRHLRHLFNDPDASRVWAFLTISVLAVLIIEFNIYVVARGTTDSYHIYTGVVTLWILLGLVTIAMERVSQIAHGKKALMRQTLHLATHDMLTNTRNRLGFQEVIDNTHPAQTTGIILCDIDHFKQVNDEHGHYVGDTVLEQFAATLIRESRDTDYVVRWGGEEFLIYTTNATEEGLQVYAEKLRSSVANEPIAELSITASFGATVCPPWEDFDVAVGRADDKLYHAKRTGRNRVVSDLEDHTQTVLSREDD